MSIIRRLDSASKPIDANSVYKVRSNNENMWVFEYATFFLLIVFTSFLFHLILG